MDTLPWILQWILAIIFLFSGINKAHFDKKTLVRKGQTGVEGLPSWLIKFVGVSEIFGALGLIIPYSLNIFPILTPLAALSLGTIMIPAAIIHLKKTEYKNVIINILLFIGCGLLAWLRAYAS